MVVEMEDKSLEEFEQTLKPVLTKLPFHPNQTNKNQG
jgi:hypothetical protein